MISARQLVREWGEESLYRIQPDFLQGVDIPDTAKAFLAEVGLPLRAELPYMFYFAPLPLKPNNLRRSWANYALLHHHPETNFYLLSHMLTENPVSFHYIEAPCCYNAIESRTGRIWFIAEHENGGEVQLINSCLPQYAESLLILRDFLAHWRLREPEIEEKKVIGRELQRRLLECDAEAMSDPEAWEWIAEMFETETDQDAKAEVCSAKKRAETTAGLNGPQCYWPRQLHDLYAHY